MSESIKWNELTPRQKTECIVRDVLRWKYFPEWDIKHTARWALEGEVTWPYAFWNGPRDGICVFYAPNEHARPFNPLTSLDDAWQIVEHLMSSEIFYLQTRTSEAGRFYTAELFGKMGRASVTTPSMPESICRAALAVCGVWIE